MKRLRYAVLMIVCLLFNAQAAHAQFPAVPSYTPLTKPTPPGPVPPPQEQKPSRRMHGGIGIYPFAIFDIGGTFAGPSGTQSLYGGLFSADFGVEDSKHNRYEWGGWYWGKSGSDLYEAHLRFMNRKGFGIQGGYLNSFQGFVARPSATQPLSTDASAYDVFLIYDLNASRLGGSAQSGASRLHQWDIQFGAGIYIDNTPHVLLSAPVNGVGNHPISYASTANYTFFVAASQFITPRITITASDWVLRDRYQDLNRLAFGVGYSF